MGLEPHPLAVLARKREARLEGAEDHACRAHLAGHSEGEANVMIGRVGADRPPDPFEPWRLWWQERTSSPCSGPKQHVSGR